MTEVITQAVAALNEKMGGEGFDGSAKFEIADVGHWTGQHVKGTVLLFPGRTEYIEKYGPAAADFLARGFATVVIDWRGQGLADRTSFICVRIPWGAASDCVPCITPCPSRPRCFLRPCGGSRWRL